MAQADVLTPAGEVRTRQGTFPNTRSGEGSSPDYRGHPFQSVTVPGSSILKVSVGTRTADLPITPLV
jgi:hypothetical protein